MASNGNVVPVNGHSSSNAAKHNIPSHFIGGNHLDAAPPGPVRDFVANHAGHSVISSVRSPLVLWIFLVSLPSRRFELKFGVAVELTAGDFFF